jgi:hypothetical protein
MHTVFGEEREHLQDLVVDGTIILKIILGREWLKTGANGEYLLKQELN